LSYLYLVQFLLLSCTVAAIRPLTHRRIGEASNPGPVSWHGLDDSQADFWPECEYDDADAAAPSSVPPSPWSFPDVQPGHAPLLPSDIPVPDDSDQELDPPPQLIATDDEGQPIAAASIADSSDDDSDSDSDDPIWVRQTWRRAEAAVGLAPPRQTAPLKAVAPPTAPLPAGAKFVPSKSFCGPIAGYVFTTREKVTGYYAERTRGATPHQLERTDCLASLRRAAL